MMTTAAGFPPATTAAAASFPRRTSTHTISDDDDVTQSNGNSGVAQSFATLRENHLQATMSLRENHLQATLRQNHLEALRAAAANAGLVQTAPAPQTAATAASGPSTNYQHDVATPVAQEVATVAASARAVPRADGSKEMFPMRLHALLSDPTVRDVISWLPHGGSFVVLRPDVFATRVLPLYFAPEGSNSLNAKTALASGGGKGGTLVVRSKSFQGVHKYPSFTRKLNRWGFRQISRGADAGAFCHELFRRDDPQLCRGMVCQKSRKSSSKRSLGATGGFQDDMMSVSSASTMGTKSIASVCEKRPYSSTVTVSTAGNTSNKSLPFKKRKSGQHITNSYMVNDIPSMISHRNQKMPASNSSVTESDLTSDGGSVCSNNVVPKSAAAKADATTNNVQTAEAAAREALARHFHEQHRAFALASLMENSRLAMRAVGIQNQACGSTPPAVASAHRTGQDRAVRAQAPILGAMTTHSPSVFAPTVTIPEVNGAPSAANHVPATVADSSAEAAKRALYKAYLQALSNSNNAVAAAPDSS